MPRPCASCAHPRRAELDRRLRSGSTLADAARWTRDPENAPAIGINALGRHRAHLGVTSTPSGPRPKAATFLEAVRAVAWEDLEAGATRPSIKDGISADAELNRQRLQGDFRDLARAAYMALTGQIPGLGDGIPEAEYRELDEDEQELNRLLALNPR